MKTVKNLELLMIVLLGIVISILFQSCDPNDDCEDEPPCDTCMVAYKPNIYIYPLEDIELSVKLSFPMGGHVVASIPEYGSGWNVWVNTDGLINNTYTYLFYESTQPDIWQRTHGWNVETEKLALFFTENLTAYGFEDNEIIDFIEYWIPRLDDYLFYSIFPQTKEVIDDVIQLEFSMQPENILRLFYVVEGHNQLPNKLAEPIVEPFNREGYFATEWGVVL